MQLLYYQAPLSALILLLLVPVFEPVSSTIVIPWTVSVVVSDQYTYNGDIMLLCDSDSVSRMLNNSWLLPPNLILVMFQINIIYVQYTTNG
jgi:hypothetical protein